MPKVGTRRFPYTPEGIAAAQAYAAATGQKVENQKPRRRKANTNRAPRVRGLDRAVRSVESFAPTKYYSTES